MDRKIRTSSLRSGHPLTAASRRRWIIGAAGVLVPVVSGAFPPLSLKSPPSVSGYTSASGGGSAPTFGAGATTSAANNDFSEAFATSGSDRLLLVMIGGWRSGGWTCTGVTYNGVAMTRWRKETSGGDGCDVFYLVSPATGSNTVAASFSTSPTESIMTMAYFNGVNQTTPLRAGSSSGGSTGVNGSWTASSSIASATGDLAVILYEWWESFTIGAGQTSRVTGMVANPVFVGGTVATAVGAATVTPSGTVNNNTGGLVWVGASIQPL